jgi:hypothetical protein
MIWLYLVLATFYVLNSIIFLIIHLKKNKLKVENSNYTRMVSLFDDDGINEPLLNEFA